MQPEPNMNIYLVYERETLVALFVDVRDAERYANGRGYRVIQRWAEKPSHVPAYSIVSWS